jgi:hypothetical protein
MDRRHLERDVGHRRPWLRSSPPRGATWHGTERRRTVTTAAGDWLPRRTNPLIRRRPVRPGGAPPVTVRPRRQQAHQRRRWRRRSRMRVTGPLPAGLGRPPLPRAARAPLSPAAAPGHDPPHHRPGLAEFHALRRELASPLFRGLSATPARPTKHRRPAGGAPWIVIALRLCRAEISRRKHVQIDRGSAKEQHVVCRPNLSGQCWSRVRSSVRSAFMLKEGRQSWHEIG